ncbi:MAG TPA: DEAD/DEAH box helicase [Azospira sp.]|nr:DEAD/DEAH box helicase [Azospira sp.]
MTFPALGLSLPLLQALDALDYKTPTPVQTQAIPAVLEGKDLMAAAQTGTGKTAGFALPLLQRLAEDPEPTASNSVRALVLVPTRELAQQVSDSFHRYGQFLPLRVYAVYGGVSINPQMMKLRKGIDILVATPGRLLDLHRQNAVQFGQVRTLVLDEADRMLDLGFARELNALFGLLPKQRQTLLFSATFSDAIRGMANQLLKKPLCIETARPNATAKGIKQWVVPVDKKRKSALFCHLYKNKKWDQVLVFVKTRKGVEELVSTLAAKGIAADSIHGDKPQPARLRALESFKAGEARVLVATDVASRGLDIDDLPRVVNFDLPIVAEDYVHRIGRTARAGASGEAVSLVCADEVNLLGAIEVLIGHPLSRIEQYGFEPDHRVPETGPAGQVMKKPKKPKKALRAQALAASAKTPAAPGRGRAGSAGGRRGSAPAGKAAGPGGRKPGPKSRGR